MFARIASAMCLALGLAAPAAAVEFDRKVALVIGNSAYENATPLANPVRDAKAIAGLLGDLGFETVVGYDLDRNGMNETLRDFARASRDADLTLFFYAGHGIGFSGRNYLVPVDAAFRDATALDFEAMPVDFVTKQMRYSDGVSLVFLDACRDNPLAGPLSRSLGTSTRSALSRGLTQMELKEAGRGLAIAFATSPGEVAYDGAGDHSPFTDALLSHLKAPDTDITEVMSRVTGDVLKATDEKQRPWLNASLTGPVILNPDPAPAAEQSLQFAKADPQAVAPGGDLQAQTLLFNLARESGLASDYEAYLATFPTGLYAYNARQALKTIGTGIARAGVVTAAIAPKAAQPAAPATVEAVATADAVPAAPPATETAAPAHGEPTAPAAEVPAQTVVAALADDAGETVATDALDASKPAPVSAAAEQAAPAALPPASPESEAALALSRDARREIQHRLNIAGSDVGGADGLFGPRTRTGINAWQEREGYEATGYLNAAQVDALKVATEAEYASHLAQIRAAAAARAEARRAAAARKTTARKRTTSRRATTTQRRTTTKRRTTTTAKRTAPATAAKKAPAQEDAWRGRRRLNAAQIQKATNQAKSAGLFK